MAEVAQGNTAWEAAQMDAWVNSATEEQDQQSQKAKAAFTSLCTLANVVGFPFAVCDMGPKKIVAQGSGELLSVMQL